MPETPRSPLAVLLLADPGLTTRQAEAVRAPLEQRLAENFAVDVSLSVRTQSMSITSDDTLDLSEAHRISDEYDRMDAVLVLTEMPRHTRGHPLIAEVFTDEHVAVVSSPTVGAVVSKGRIVQVMTNAMRRLFPDRVEASIEDEEFGWSRWSRTDTGTLTLHASTLTAGPRTVVGMAMSNDPWRTAPLLSSAMAAAFGTGAFGIFYNSIWQMAEHLSTVRLVLIGLLSVLTMVTWLIVSNGLWDRPRRRSLKTVVLLYNASTVLTLTVCVMALFFLLVAVILVAGLIVIDSDFMATIVSGPIGFSNYVSIAWFSAAMGVVAGGFGTSFDSRADLRRLTHGQRERQRVTSEDDLEVG